ncbi:N-6 DNA methylase [Phycicoccus sp. HDW14]|uniref:N-6 DNA methylase n=1 Tax=Phycicoccus sp. HDW14 TaxID=2714941 RepID=UPI00210FD21A|nr:N-6 DNA methylase [Phycicoccus sp. HDW14]
MHSDLLELAGIYREAALAGLDPRTQSSMGQFFTPTRAAALIASMPRLPQAGSLRIIDPGAGSGVLSAAIIARILDETSDVTAHVVAVEADPAVLPHLLKTLDACETAGRGRVTYEMVEADYIFASTGLSADVRLDGFDLCIQNPPYAKLPSKSPVRAAIRAFGADAPNLYAAFLALGAASLVEGGSWWQSLPARLRTDHISVPFGAICFPKSR